MIRFDKDFLSVFCSCKLQTMHHQMAGHSPDAPSDGSIQACDQFLRNEWIDYKLQAQLIQLIQQSSTDNVTQMSQSNGNKRTN